MLITARKWVPKKKKEKNTSLGDIKFEALGGTAERKIDPIRAIQRIF